MKTEITRVMKTRKIADILQVEIKRRHLKAGMPLLSARQIAGKYHCSMKTANAALDLLKAEQLITRVKGSGNFVRNCMVNGHRLVIGLADDVNKETDPRKQALIEVFPVNALRYFKKHRYDYRIIPYMAFKEQDSEVFEGLDGLLLSSNFIDEDTLPFIRQLHFPLVIYKSEYELGLPYPQVVPNLQIAIEDMFTYVSPVLFQGIIIVYHKHPNGMARCRAFLKAAEKAGFTEKNITLVELLNNDGLKIPQGTLEKDITGKLILSCSDLSTYDIVIYLAERNLRCGIDYQIVGFDNLAGCMKLPFHYPEITSIDYPRESAAQAAARLLISLIVKKSSICYQILKFPTKLTIRESAFSEHAGVF